MILFQVRQFSLGTEMRKMLLVLLFVLTNTSGFAQDEPIRLAVILDTSEPLQVRYVSPKFKKNVQVSALGGLVGGLIHGASIASKDKSLEERLRASVGSRASRDLELQLGLAEAFARETPHLVLDFLPNDYLRKGKPNFARFDAKRNSHVLVVEEYAGLSTPNIRWGSLVAQSTLKLRLYDTKTKKRIIKEKIQGIGPHTDDIDTALDSPEFFLKTYPSAVRALGFGLYWRLNGRNGLHSIAKNTPHAQAFPSIEALLKRQSALFDFDRPKLKGWRTPRTGTPYLFSNEPKKDKKQVAIVTDIDLLIKEFGQDFESLDPYIELRIDRLVEMGWDTSVVSEVPILNVDPEWISYGLPDPRGGTAIFLHRRNNQYVTTHQIVVLDEDPVPLLTKYQQDIEGYINQSALRMK